MRFFSALLCACGCDEWNENFSYPHLVVVRNFPSPFFSFSLIRLYVPFSHKECKWDGWMDGWEGKKENWNLYSANKKENISFLFAPIHICGKHVFWIPQQQKFSHTKTSVKNNIYVRLTLTQYVCVWVIPACVKILSCVFKEKHFILHLNKYVLDTHCE